jgi:hypothetical protein
MQFKITDPVHTPNGPAIVVGQPEPGLYEVRVPSGDLTFWHEHELALDQNEPQDEPQETVKSTKMTRQEALAKARQARKDKAQAKANPA